MIWIIGGTVNATDVCKLLIAQTLPVLVSVTTEYGKELAQQTGAVVIQSILAPCDMRQLIGSREIKVIVDASHPFAAEVSQNAMEAALVSSIPYLRFERPNEVFEGVRYFSSYQSVVDCLMGTTGKILLTTGSKHIAEFLPLGANRLVARVLSTAGSVALCEEAGLKPSQIIAMPGRCSKEFNLSLLREFDVKFLVTKESGADGGIYEKIEAAKMAGVEVIIIKRPKIVYHEVFEEYDALINRIKKVGIFTGS